MVIFQRGLYFIFVESRGFDKPPADPPLRPAPDKIVRGKNFFRLFRFILLLIDLTKLTLIHRKMLLIVLILHFLMIIAPSITATDTPSSPILMLWIDTQYEILTFLV